MLLPFVPLTPPPAVSPTPTTPLPFETPPEVRHYEFEAALQEITAHASWHLGKTIPDILGNRRWPTSQLKGSSGAGGGGGGREGGGSVSVRIGGNMSELKELIEDLRACDPRVLEMAGIEVRGSISLFLFFCFCFWGRRLAFCVFCC